MLSLLSINIVLFDKNLGAAEEAAAVFGEAAAFCIQKQYVNCSPYPNPHLSSEECNVVTARQSVSEDASPRQLKHMQGLKDIAASHHGTSMIGGTAAQPIHNGPSNMSFYNTPSPMTTQVILFFVYAY